MSLKKRFIFPSILNGDNFPNIPNTGTQQEIFHGRGGFMKLGHFDKQGKVLEFFLLDTHETTF